PAGGLPLQAGHRTPELAGQHHLLAVWLQCGPQNGFGLAATVIVTAIEQRDAVVQCRLYHGGRLRGITRCAEVIAAEADGGDRQAGVSKLANAHAATLAHGSRRSVASFAPLRGSATPVRRFRWPPAATG